jgi:hypothetical protein
VDQAASDPADLSSLGSSMSVKVLDGLANCGSSFNSQWLGLSPQVKMLESLEHSQLTSPLRLTWLVSFSPHCSSQLKQSCWRFGGGFVTGTGGCAEEVPRLKPDSLLEGSVLTAEVGTTVVDVVVAVSATLLEVPSPDG